ncbi:MAG: peptidoglycan-binding domain-containing protein [Myxococcales bacterium]|nr:peptidoglycan-binding domain-containing protein [Myxococcales bacterium]MDP3502651.1 peptidoglycan-binding domain-containing protein [Myxococcales bacterium]
MSTLQVGSRGDSVRRLQDTLRSAGFNPGSSDGAFGPRTKAAVQQYQAARRLEADGIVGTRTMQALRRDGFDRRTTPPVDINGGNTRGPNGTATIDAPRQGRGLVTGSITVNGNTYRFNSGSSRLFSTPQGTYTVRAHRNSRSDAGFTRNGVGYSYVMEDPNRPGSDRFYDPRAGRDRQYLRIHPDGGGTGTAGCLGIVGDAATLRRFREDMNAELARNGGRYTLRVR